MNTEVKLHKNLPAPNKPEDGGDSSAITDIKASSDNLRGKPGLALIGLPKFSKGGEQ
jgi:hypothetical protein